MVLAYLFDWVRRWGAEGLFFLMVPIDKRVQVRLHVLAYLGLASAEAAAERRLLIAAVHIEKTRRVGRRRYRCHRVTVGTDALSPSTAVSL